LKYNYALEGSFLVVRTRYDYNYSRAVSLSPSRAKERKIAVFKTLTSFG
jgi:hypothetical protein